MSEARGYCLNVSALFNCDWKSFLHSYSNDFSLLGLLKTLLDEIHLMFPTDRRAASCLFVRMDLNLVPLDKSSLCQELDWPSNSGLHCLSLASKPLSPPTTILVLEIIFCRDYSFPFRSLTSVSVVCFSVISNRGNNAQSLRSWLVLKSPKTRNSQLSRFACNFLVCLYCCISKLLCLLLFLGSPADVVLF